MAQELTAIVNELPTVANKLPHLERILASLGKMSKAEVQNTIEQINVNHIVECVAVESEMALSILQRLLDVVDASNLLAKFETLFIKGLTSDDDVILRMCLHQLQRVANECPHCFTSHVNIFVMLVELLFAEETGSMSLVESIIVIVGKHNVELFTCAETAKLLDLVSSEKQLRFFDAIIQMAVSSDVCLAHFLGSGVFGRLSKIYTDAVSDDPLLLLNCLELFASILTAPSALANFQANGQLAIISHDMIANKNSSFANILVPAFIKLFTTVGRTNFALLLSEYSPYFDILNASCQNSSEIGACLVGLESYAILSQLPESKELFTNTRLPSVKVDEWLKQLRTFLFRGGSDDIHAKAILITADLFTIPKHVLPTKVYFDTNARWFNVLFDSRLDQPMHWAKSPLAERHVAAQRLLIALSTQPWAQQLMAGSKGFVDFLVDRNTEKDKMGRELKYELVQSIFMSSTAANYFDGPEIVKLGVFVRQGPFYATATSTVAMEAE